MKILVCNLHMWPLWPLAKCTPDVIQGIEPEWLSDLGMARRRDPDALPPGNTFEAMMNYLYKITLTLRGGNTLFALKAALLTGIYLLALLIC